MEESTLLQVVAQFGWCASGAIPKAWVFSSRQRISSHGLLREIPRFA